MFLRTRYWMRGGEPVMDCAVYYYNVQRRRRQRMCQVMPIFQEAARLLLMASTCSIPGGLG